jgi:hypothetical protein
MVRRNDEDFAMAIDAVSSKALRNAILEGIPDYISSTFVERAKAITKTKIKEKGAKPLTAQIQDMVKAFEKMDSSIGQKFLESHLGHAIAVTTEEELISLRGIYNAAKDGQVNNLVEAFEWAASDDQQVMDAESFKQGKLVE